MLDGVSSITGLSYLRLPAGVDWPVAHAAWATRSWLLCYGHQAGASERRSLADAYFATDNSEPRQPLVASGFKSPRRSVMPVAPRHVQVSAYYMLSEKATSRFWDLACYNVLYYSCRFGNFSARSEEALSIFMNFFVIDVAAWARRAVLVTGSPDGQASWFHSLPLLRVFADKLRGGRRWVSPGYMAEQCSWDQLRDGILNPLPAVCELVAC